MVDVTVAIPTRNRKDKLRRLLNSIKDSSFQDFEIIAVDDASTDGTDKMIKEEFPDIKYISHERPTLVAKSRNDAIEASQGEFIFFIDDDNVVEKDTIEKLYNYISTHDEVGVIVPVTCDFREPERVMYAGGVLSPFMRRVIGLYTGCNCKDLEGKVTEIDYSGNSFMIRRDAVKRAGLVPWKRIPMGSEDLYLQYKIKRLGYKNVILGSARVYHDHDEVSNLGTEIRRLNLAKLHYRLRTKIVTVLELDPLPKKITFLLSLPIYVGWYSYIGLKNVGLRGVKAVIEGVIDGLKKSEEVKYLNLVE